MDYISIATFIFGFIIAELIRRWNRAETFNSCIFNTRLKVYCDLFSLIANVYSEMTEFIETAKKDSDSYGTEIEEIHFSIVEPLLRFIDENALFLSEELCIQCSAMFMCNAWEDGDWLRYSENIMKQNKNAVEMIKVESGMSYLNKSMKKIIKYSHNSPIISYYHKMSKQQKKQKKGSNL